MPIHSVASIQKREKGCCWFVDTSKIKHGGEEFSFQERKHSHDEIAEDEIITNQMIESYMFDMNAAVVG